MTKLTLPCRRLRAKSLCRPRTIQADQLHQPLNKTLPLDTPPLPGAPDRTEKATIDKLTLPHEFTYELQALQTGGAVRASEASLLAAEPREPLAPGEPSTNAHLQGPASRDRA